MENGKKKLLLSFLLALEEIFYSVHVLQNNNNNKKNCRV